jgi:hypothetical protein
MECCIKLYEKYVYEKSSGAYALDVCIAEWAAHGTHCLADRDRTRVCVAQSHRITEFRSRRCGVPKGDGTVDGVSAARGVEVLPSPPHTVNLRMVEIEPMRVSATIPIEAKHDVTYHGSPGEVKKSEPGSPPTVK